MKKLLVVGSGISGISISKMLYEYFDVNVFVNADGTTQTSAAAGPPDYMTLSFGVT